VKNSVLELKVGGLPFPHGRLGGEWRYSHAVRPEGPSALDHQVVADFLCYETAHRRPVDVVADRTLADWQSWREPQIRPSPGAYATQCCTHVYARGCSNRLVCHGAPALVAAQILAEGALRSSAEISGREAADLAAASTWGAPADYFEYVMFANGRCTAPEAVAYSHLLGRDLIPTDLTAGYPPAVRLYFAWETLAARTDARFDGVHPVKIYQSLQLDGALVAIVVHASQRLVVEPAAGRFRDRLIVLNTEEASPDHWATEATTAAEQLQ
jgi:hypothetical protein